MSDSEPPLHVWCAGKDWCALSSTAKLIGKKWHPVIVARLLERDPLGFNRLQEAVDGISSKVLSDSLEDLEEKQLVERTVVSEKPFRVEYALTDTGESLEPVVNAMRDWGAEHLSPAADKESSIA
ncbi:MAG: winged helix-turn-helix transcriptional regulator [Halobacteriaceae archaeon]